MATGFAVGRPGCDRRLEWLVAVWIAAALAAAAPEDFTGADELLALAGNPFTGGMELVPFAGVSMTVALSRFGSRGGIGGSTGLPSS